MSNDWPPGAPVKFSVHTRDHDDPERKGYKYHAEWNE